jgi:phosphatidylserine/phosphatidylglycerophosphate/cardiolipin synthase-like enzyme
MNTNNWQQAIAIEAGVLAKMLPFSLVETLAETIQGTNVAEWAQARTRIIQGISHPHYRDKVACFLDSWKGKVESVSPQAVALALLTAACCEKAKDNGQGIELVWTGPDVGIVPLRRTEQALLQVIDSACLRVTVVSYTVYQIPHICEALVRAADRGVSISVIVETPDRLEGSNSYDTLKALGPSVASRCKVFLWPLENRQKDTGGRTGLLHVKSAVADGRWLFLSSANLTEYAFTLNMELGLLVTGGDLPVQVEGHFDRMIQIGLLVGL